MSTSRLDQPSVAGRVNVPLRVSWNGSVRTMSYSPAGRLRSSRMPSVSVQSSNDPAFCRSTGGVINGNAAVRSERVTSAPWTLNFQSS